MTAKMVYDTALSLLGYTERPNFQRRAIAIINQVIFDLLPVLPKETEFKPISSLSDKLPFNETIIQGVMPLSVAEKLALSEGDGELQQYFAISYDNAKKRLNTTRTIQDTMP